MYMMPGRRSILTPEKSIDTSFFFIFYVFLPMNIATSPFSCSHDSLLATFAAMEKTEAVEERESECTPIRVASRKNESQPVKLTDKLWIVKEVLNFDKEASQLSKRFALKRKDINQWVCRYRAKIYMKNYRGQSTALNAEVTKKIVERLKGHRFLSSTRLFQGQSF